MTDIREHNCAQKYNDVENTVLDSLKKKNPAAFQIFEFEYQRAIKEVRKLGYLNIK